MSENPYQSPAEEQQVVGVLSGNREDLIMVAKYQRRVLVCVVLYVLLAVARQSQTNSIPLSLAVGAALLVGTVCIFMLSIKVYGTGVGVILGILGLVPCLNLIVLLVVNNKATRVLRQNGIHVGFLGVDPRKI